MLFGNSLLTCILFNWPFFKFLKHLVVLTIFEYLSLTIRSSPSENFPTYLLGIVRNCLEDHIKIRNLKITDYYADIMLD